ncbi:LysM peptidoglycan-binding domain-containing protein [Vibrio owensii]|uniref:LysM peptidoglycan-binding domain-containing protein n=1 Tax=Vibrio owensii TaxID=696485 RepID=UPI0003A8A2A7|nr:LysM domain-containing protein [Vibrio owensii]
MKKLLLLAIWAPLTLADTELVAQYFYLSTEDNQSSQLPSLSLGFDVYENIAIGFGGAEYQDNVSPMIELSNKWELNEGTHLTLRGGAVGKDSLYTSLGYQWNLYPNLDVGIAYQFNFALDNNFTDSSGIGASLIYRFTALSDEEITPETESAIRPSLDNKEELVTATGENNNKETVSPSSYEKSKDKKLNTHTYAYREWVASSGDSYFSIAQEIGIHYYSLMCINNLEPSQTNNTALMPGRRLLYLEKSESFYQVKLGDTASNIASSQGVTLETLMKLNPCPKNRDFNLIYPGELIKVTP